MVELTWKEHVKIPNGEKTGEITKIQYRTDPFEYTDILVKLDGTDIELKYGCPTVLSENSKLGKLVKLFGSAYQKDGTINIETLLVGKRVTFMTMMKESKKDKIEYAEIVEDSLKPVL